ncbi:transcriptional regulator, AraC family [Paenibacillus curdlanolyticus YK9]|uniref:Transcriptional regulator, AraC family n=1 Tax=Paenibacillus curdlanolyticus YK9 TaxID=717606 RepID=E0IBX3_9BACL|nr:AraC family transcriptional regulator [Paenibacillus curdlanolyticus]EFM10203.1 transcriptional regulator, AraC family [Paenibacillus curdlanolyticus YK9]
MEAELLSCGYSRHSTPFSSKRIHSLPSYLFRLQIEGRGQALVNDIFIDLLPGSLLLFQPGEPYELNLYGAEVTGTDSADYYLYCSGPWIDRWWKRTKRQQHFHINLDDRIITLWRQMVFESRIMTPDSHELNSYLLQSLCLCLDRAIAETGEPFTITQMKRYIEEHASTPFKLEDVAQHVGLSVSRAVHLFREWSGTTIVRYALDIRLSMAVERMKHTPLKLEQIALDCGFNSYPYFHRAFKEKYGLTPALYRG